MNLETKRWINFRSDNSEKPLFLKILTVGVIALKNITNADKVNSKTNDKLNLIDNVFSKSNETSQGLLGMRIVLENVIGFSRHEAVTTGWRNCWTAGHETMPCENFHTLPGDTRTQCNNFWFCLTPSTKHASSLR